MVLAQARWGRIRMAVASVSLALAAAAAVTGVTTQRTIYVLAALAFGIVPIAYGAIGLAGRRGIPRGAFVGFGVAAAGVVAVAAWLTFTSCQNRLGPGVSLSGCDFARAVLGGEDLHGADLSEADLAGSDLTSADLSDADLSNASLVGAALDDADLVGARLVDADMRDSDLSGANLESAELTGADLRGAILNGTTLLGVTMSRANLAGVDIPEVMMPGSDLSGSDFTGALLRDADLRDSDLSDAVLDDVGLASATLTGVDLSGASLVGANLVRADLSGSDLTGADLTEASLDHVALIGIEGLDDAGLADALGVAPDELAQALSEHDISLEGRQEILAALSGACRGGVPGAASLTNGGFRPLALFGANGDRHKFTDEVPGSWEPRSTRFAQLVACVGSDRRELVETCRYFNVATGAPVDPVRRFSRSVSVRVVTARTGKIVAQRVFSSAPEHCSFQVFGAYDETLVGDAITFDTLRNWLQGYVR